MTTPTTMTSPAIAWTIAASDSGGAAGIQADLKTFFDLGVHGCSVITALTAQNSCELNHVQATDPASLQAQLQTLANDLQPAAIKVGVIPTLECLTALQTVLEDQDCFVVLDPVLKASSGNALTRPEVIDALPLLYSQLSLLTPNIPEAERLTGLAINNHTDQIKAADQLLQQGLKAVLIKGGHGSGEVSQDYFSDGETHFWLSHPRQPTPHSHGTGCTLSSAIAAFVTHGKDLRDALVLAHAYVQQGLRLAQPLGSGIGAVTQAGWPSYFADFPQISATPDAINQAEFKRCDSLALGLYPVVDNIEWLQRLLPLGVKTIQLRVKNKTDEELDQLVAEAAALGRRYNARLFINDYWQLAIKHQAYGVHLGQEDLDTADLNAIREAGLHLGLSTHSEYEWARAATVKPSYLALGTVFPTQTKPAILIGLDNLYRWVATLGDDFPLVAIGGIKEDNLYQVLPSKVGSVAVVTAITEAEDYAVATQSLLQRIEGSNSGY